MRTTRNLEDLINSGNPPFDFTFNDVSGQPVLYTGGGQAFSKGEQIFYFKVDDKTIIGFASEDGDGTFDGASNPGTTTLGDGSYGDGSNDDRIVFVVTLDTGGEDGAWTIEIYDQFDHPLTDNPGTGATEIAFEDLLSLNLTSTLHAEDADNDPLDFTGDAWTVGVIDDTPIVLDSAQECITVDEDDIKNFQSIGTSPNDGNGDGSETGNPPSNVFGPAFASGSLAGLVKVGADEIGSDDSGNGTGKFSLIELNNDTLTELGLIGLRSQGDLISYLVVAGDGVPGPSEVLEARASDGRLVFTLEVFEDGDYEFSLHDQMDHDPPYDIDPPGFDSNDNPFFPGNTLIPPADQNTDLVDFDDDNTPPGEPRNFDIDELNLGALIQFEDYDHDAVTLDGEFVVKIRDDIPEIKHGKDICLTVDEDDIDTGAPTGSDGNHPNDGNADGSWTGSPFNPSDPGPATVFGALGGLFGIVQPGADEPLTFSFIVQGGIGEHVVTELAELAGLSSKGEDLSYDIQGNVLYGYVNGGVGIAGRGRVEADGEDGEALPAGGEPGVAAVLAQLQEVVLVDLARPARAPGSGRPRRWCGRRTGRPGCEDGRCAGRAWCRGRAPPGGPGSGWPGPGWRRTWPARRGSPRSRRRAWCGTRRRSRSPAAVAPRGGRPARRQRGRPG